MRYWCTWLRELLSNSAPCLLSSSSSLHTHTDTHTETQTHTETDTQTHKHGVCQPVRRACVYVYTYTPGTQRGVGAIFADGPTVTIEVHHRMEKSVS